MLLEFSINFKICSLTNGCIIDSKRVFFCSSLNISDLSKLRSILLLVSRNSLPKLSTNLSFAYMLESKMFLETLSASITSIPSSIKNLAAEEFPDPIPPVSPTIIP